MSTTVSNEVPEAVASLGETMAGYPGVWALCGGWAVDAWLGRVTRKHGDVDLAVFAHDQQSLFEHLDGWQMLGHDEAWEPNNADVWWDGSRRVTVPGHIHARPPERSGAVPKDGIATLEDGFWLDIQICEADDGEWLMQREPRISASLADCIRESPWGLPTAVAEVLLYYKAHEPRQRDRRDFDLMSPSLSGEQRGWLRDAIARAEHPWVRKLG